MEAAGKAETQQASCLTETTSGELRSRYFSWQGLDKEGTNGERCKETQARRTDHKIQQAWSKYEVKRLWGVRRWSWSSSERGWSTENPPEVQQAITASNSPHFSNSGSCSSLWFSGGTTCVLTSSEQKSSLHNPVLREGGGMGTGQSPTTSPSPHSQLSPVCLCSCSTS